MSAQCDICNLSFDSVKKYVCHLQTHANVSNIKFKCFFSYCHQTWKSYSSLKTHIARFHKHQVTKTCSDSMQHGNFKCSVMSCCETFALRNELVSHLKKHIKCGTTVQCPIYSCERKFKNISSLTAHISRYHNISQVRTDQYETVNHTYIPNEVGNPGQSLEVPMEERHKSTLHDLSLFYIKLFVKYHVPNSTIQLVFDEFSKLQKQSFSEFSQKVLSKLTHQGLSSEVVLNILNSSWSTVDFMVSHECLKTKHLRYEFFKKHLHYLEPVAIRLGFDAQNKPSLYHYIPVKESIKLLLADQTVYKQVKYPETYKDGLYSDFTDGNAVKNNSFFEPGHSVLQLLLYQDSFEVANPLGSARTKHKILAVYYILGNLHRHNRSKVDPIQLVLLIKERDFKFFGQGAVFKKLIEDLKDIERNGIIINENETMKGSVAFIIGDNLGSHTVGGFTENFSSPSGHICRYCETTKSQFQRKPHCLTAAPRDVQSYDFAVQQLEAGTEAPVKGIKFNSPFNSLQYFHVCNPGLPPCLAHDVFEGIVAFDLAIYIKYFVEIKKAFSYTLLNNKIQNFSYHEEDARSKPCVIKKFCGNKCKLIGNAAQNWCLLRFFLFIIKDNTELICETVWRLISLLQEIVALICAYDISPNQIAYLRILIQDYLYHRREFFPNYPLRPKHHFLLHYPHLIMDCGPLIWLWTLRFESKHSFFKRSISTSKNFRNVTGSLAEKHQLLQAYLKSGDYFDLSVQMSQSIIFHVDTYSDAIQSAVFQCQNKHDESCTQAGQSITIKDRVYKCGQVVNLEFEQCKFYIGKIKLILFDGLDVHFIVKKLTAVKVPNTQYFEVLISEKNEFICVPHNKTYGAPLPLYRAHNNEFIVPKQSPPFI